MAIDLDSQPTEQWLDCQLEKGMFSDEIAVTYPAIGDVKKSVFVPRSSVKGTAGERGKVRVLIVRRGSKTLAVLPNSHKDIVEVVEGDLTE